MIYSICTDCVFCVCLCPTQFYDSIGSIFNYDESKYSHKSYSQEIIGSKHHVTFVYTIRKAVVSTGLSARTGKKQCLSIISLSLSAQKSQINKLAYNADQEGGHS